MAFFARLLRGLPIRRKLRNFATELLPALDRNIDILAIDVDAVAHTLALLGGNQALEHRTNGLVGKIMRVHGLLPAGTPANP